MSGHAHLTRSDLEGQLGESKTTNNNLRTHIQYLECQQIGNNTDDE